MSTNGKTILILGATGQQGGSVARALKGDGWHVRALVRNVESEKAIALAATGTETVQGDLRDVGSLRSATQGAYGVFSVQPSSGQPEYGVTDADEVQYGFAVADVALEAGVEHFVYSSVAGSRPNTGVGHYDSKWRIEENVRSLPLDWTVIRPAAFMEILLLPYFGLAANQLTFFMRPDRPMQFIAVEDIGAIVAKVFADRAAFRGKTIDIAGDSVTGDELAAKISAATARPVSYQRFPDAVLADVPAFGRLVELIEAGLAAGSADLEELRQLHPDLLSFDAWLRRTGKALIQAL